MADIPITIGLETIVGDSIAQLTGIVKLIGELGERLVTLAKEGDVASDVFGALRISIKEAQEATGHEVRALDLAIAANSTFKAGLRLTGQEFANFAGFAKRSADITKGDFNATLEQLTKAAITGRTKGITPLIGEVKLHGDASQRAAQLSELLAEKLKTLGKGAETAGDAIARLETAAQDWLDQLGKSFTESEKLAGALDDLGKAFKDTGITADEVGHLLTTIAIDAVQAWTQLANLVKKVFSAEAPGWFGEWTRWASTLGMRRSDPVGDEAERGRYLRAWQRGRPMSFGATDLAGVQARARAASTDSTLLETLAIEGDPNATENRPRRAGSGSGRRSGTAAGYRNLADSQDQLGALEEQAKNLEREANAERTVHESVSRGLDAAEERQRQWLDTRQQGTDEFLADLQRRREAVESDIAQDARDSQRRQQLAEDELAIHEEINRRSIEGFRAAAEAGGAIAQQAAELLGVGEAEKMWILAITETALAAASLAKPDYVGAASHAFAAALAGKAAVQLGGKSKGGETRVQGMSGGPALQAGGAFPGGGTSGNTSGGGRGDINIAVHVQGMSLSTADSISDAVRKALIHESRNGRKLPRTVVEA